MKFEQVNINLTLEPDVVKILQIAINHLAMSIDNGSFDAGTKAQQDSILDNLHGLHIQMDKILKDFS